MKDILKHKGFMGSVHFSVRDNVLCGKIEGIDDLVTFESDNVNGLIEAFQEEVESYIKLCKEIGKECKKSYKGGFNVRISPEMHRKAAEKATEQGQSLNQFVQKAIEKELIHN